MTDSAVTDLPEPDSPTSATVCPFPISNETRSTASVSRSRWRNATERSRTERRGVDASLIVSLENLAWIEGVAHRFADEDQERQHDRDREEAAEAEPWSLDVGLAFAQHLAERRRTGRQAEPQEVERGQGHHGGRQDERQERHGCHHGVRQQVPKHDHGIRDTERACGLDVFEIAATQ